MLRIPGVKQMTVSTEVPGAKVGWNAGGIRLVNDDDPTTANQYRVIGIDHDFLDVYGLRAPGRQEFLPRARRLVFRPVQ